MRIDADAPLALIMTGTHTRATIALGDAAVDTFGFELAAHWVALRLPADLEHRLGDRVLRQLDRRLFLASALPQERRDIITRRFAEAARVAAPDVPYRVAFRRVAGTRGVNALALPGGTILLLDGLVEMPTTMTPSSAFWATSSAMSPASTLCAGYCNRSVSARCGRRVG